MEPAALPGFLAMDGDLAETANPAAEGRIRAQNVEATTGIEPVYAVLQTAP